VTDLDLAWRDIVRLAEPGRPKHRKPRPAAQPVRGWTVRRVVLALVNAFMGGLVVALPALVVIAYVVLRASAYVAP
jgi:hypothetical protein